MLLSRHGHIKLADFGLAAVVDISEASAFAKSKNGTAVYFSPEKADGAGYNSKADMWAAGCLLIELGKRERLREHIHSGRAEVRAQREAWIALVGSMTGSALLEEVARGLLQYDQEQRLSGNDMLYLLQTPVAKAVATPAAKTATPKAKAVATPAAKTPKGQTLNPKPYTLYPKP